MAVFQYQLIKKDTKRKFWDTERYSGASGLYESAHNSHGRKPSWSPFLQPLAHEMRDSGLFCVHQLRTCGAFGSTIQFWGNLVRSSTGVTCGESGRNAQAGESRSIPTAANYTSLSLHGQYDTAFSQFAALALNRCQSKQKIIIHQTRLRCGKNKRKTKIFNPLVIHGYSQSHNFY